VSDCRGLQQCHCAKRLVWMKCSEKSLPSYYTQTVQCASLQDDLQQLWIQYCSQSPRTKWQRKMKSRNMIQHTHNSRWRIFIIQHFTMVWLACVDSKWRNWTKIKLHTSTKAWKQHCVTMRNTWDTKQINTTTYTWTSETKKNSWLIESTHFAQPKFQLTGH